MARVMNEFCFEAPCVLEDGLRALCANPLAPFFARDVEFEWLLWPFRSFEAALEFADESGSWGFATIIMSRDGLTEQERKIALEVCRG